MTLTVQGDLRAILAEVERLRPDRLTLALNQAWADDAAKRLFRNIGGGPGTTYLRYRSGATRDSVQSRADAHGGAVSAEGPGLPLQEEGGIIRARAGHWLTFRLYRPSDGREPTGNWVRVRQVRVPARHPVRDAAVGALDVLQAELYDLLGGEAV